MFNKAKFQFLVLAIATLAFVLVAPSVFAQDHSPTVTTFDLRATNVRTGPGFQYTVRGVVYGDATFDLVGRNDFATGRICDGFRNQYDMWLQIDYNGVEGWVARCAVNVDAIVDNLPVIEASASQLIADLEIDYNTNLAPTTLENVPDSAYVTGQTSSFINLRETPSLSGDILDVIPRFNAVYITGRTADNSWFYVQYDNYAGWVAGYLLLIPRGWEDIVPVR